MLMHSTLFKDYMSRALLDGVKTETRRFHRLPIGVPIYVKEPWQTFASLDKVKPTELWTKGGERGAGFRYAAGGSMSITIDGRRTYDTGEVDPPIGKNRVSIHMPAFASRQTIIVDKIWEEPLLGLSDEAAIAEGIRQVSVPGDVRMWFGVLGVEDTYAASPCGAYFKLWDLINGKDSHWKNPIVFVHQFRHFPVNIEEVANG